MKLNNTYVLTEMKDNIVALPISDSNETSRHVVRLNKTAAEIWHGIEEEKSLEEIADELVKKYDGVDKTSALKYTKDVVNKLIEAKIIID